MSNNVAPLNPVPRLTQIAMAIRPEGLIADDVCPRVQVEGEKFVYTRFATEEYFTVPDTKIGRTSQASQVEFGGVDVTDSTEDYGLDDAVPVKDLRNAENTNSKYDPLGLAASGVSVLIDLAREMRVASLYFNLNTYAANLRQTLAGPSQWSDPTSDPISAILLAKDLMMVRPTDIVFGQDVWTRFRMHPKVVAAALNLKGGLGGVSAAGWARKEAIADLLEVERIHVGQGFVNQAKKGQLPVYSRVWGKHVSMFKTERVLRAARSPLPSFAFTAQWGERQAYTSELPLRGINGSVVVRVAEQVKELVSMQQCGYFFQNAVA